MYTYASGDLLKKPNAYFYTKFEGVEFLRSWRKQRDEVLKSCGDARMPDFRIGLSYQNFSKRMAESEVVDCSMTLSSLSEELAETMRNPEEVFQWVDFFVKRFELFKRIHTSYKKNLRALDIKDYQEIKLYFQAAAVFELAYTNTHELPYLNVLIKIIDTLCSLQHKLSDRENGWLAWLILEEKKHTYAIANTLGVTI